LAQQIGRELNGSHGINEESWTQWILERHQSADTSISPTAAIPHVVLPGENILGLIMLRCPQGISFSQKHPAVKAVFFLYGTLDQRQLHLESLAAIAQLISWNDFEKNWINSPGATDIKN
jgi:APA family basic amino acid/polyamine antiporter